MVVDDSRTVQTLIDEQLDEFQRKIDELTDQVDQVNIDRDEDRNIIDTLREQVTQSKEIITELSSELGDLKNKLDIQKQTIAATNYLVRSIQRGKSRVTTSDGFYDQTGEPPLEDRISDSSESSEEEEQEPRSIRNLRDLNIGDKVLIANPPNGTSGVATVIGFTPFFARVRYNDTNVVQRRQCSNIRKYG